MPSQYHLSNSPNYTFTDVLRTVPGINAGDVPMPIIIAAEYVLPITFVRRPGTVQVAPLVTEP